MRNILLIGLLVTGLPSCGTINKQRIDAQSLAALKGQTVIYTTREKPNFTASTPTKSMLGLLGAAAMASEGNSIVAANNIADPAEAIANGLAIALNELHDTRLIMPPIAVNTEDPAKIAAKANGVARFIIDVETEIWGVGFIKNDKKRYTPVYLAHVRLINTQTKTVIAEERCGMGFGEAPTTYDEMLANEALIIKKAFAANAKECVKGLKAEMLSL